MRKEDLNREIGDLQRVVTKATGERDQATRVVEMLQAALSEHKEQLQGNLLALWVFADNAGGELRIKHSDIQKAPRAPLLGMGFDDTTDEWVFTAIKPETKEENVDAQADGTSASAPASDDGSGLPTAAAAEG